MKSLQVSSIIIIIFVLLNVFSRGSGHELKVTCGFPGSPKNGRVVNLLEKYDEGMLVTYECETGYYLLGPMTRTCQANATWSGPMPFCDFSLKTLGTSSASEALNNYPPQLAVDGNSRTCFFSNRRKPRWWRVELPQSVLHNQSILSVALTLPPINAELFFSVYVIELNTTNVSNEIETDESIEQPSLPAKYHKCATFRGVFSSKTILVQCATNDSAGINGNYLQIEDDYPSLEYFGLCEVDIFVQRDQYDCGQVEIPSNGFVVDKQTSKTKIAEYSCREGFRLMGSQSRLCNTTTGQWSGDEPYCERITCQAPSPIANGFYRVFNDYQNVPVLGTRVVYECLPGFYLVSDNDTRVCDASAAWTGLANPHCEPIDCNHPESLLINPEDFMVNGAHFRLVNGTTKYSALAELVCPESSAVNRTKPTIYFRCREDGIWTESNNTSKEIVSKAYSCLKQRPNGLLYFSGQGRNLRLKRFTFFGSSSALLYALLSVVIVALVLIILILVLLIQKDLIKPPSCPFSSFHQRLKTLGQSMSEAIQTLFGRAQSYFVSLTTSKCNGDAPVAQEPGFTITSASTLSDVEMARGSLSSSNGSGDKDELNTALATFYEEITNATKQVYSADTDRKLMRAARIAAELDAIKSQQLESPYHWIYGTPPKMNTSAGGSHSLPASMPPSMCDSSYQPLPSNSEIYAKIDLIRKHRYRKEKEVSVYQVPRPIHFEHMPMGNGVASAATLSRASLAQYQLRKAISVPESVFIESNYATVRQFPNYSNVSQQANATQTLHRRNPQLLLQTSPVKSALGALLAPTQPLQVETNFPPLRTLL